MMERAIVVKMLPDGRCCQHWFIMDDAGPIKTRDAVPSMTQLGPLKLGGARGRIACRPEQNTVETQQRGLDFFPCLNSDDVRAVTCPDCLATDEAKAMLAVLKEFDTSTARG